MKTPLCSIHNQEIISVCFHLECTRPLLCEHCLQKKSIHPKGHPQDLKPFSELTQQSEWHAKCEEQRKNLLAQQNQLQLDKDKIISTSSAALDKAFSFIIDRLRQKKDELISELIESIGVDKIHKDLETQIKLLETLNFKGEEPSIVLETIQVFLNRVSPRSKALLEKVSALDKNQISPTKISQLQEELITMVYDLSIKDLYSNTPSKSLTSSKTYLAVSSSLKKLNEEMHRLKDENLKEKCNLHDRIQILLEKLNNVSEPALPNFSSKKEMPVPVSKDIISLVSTLGTKVDDLIEESAKLRRKYESTNGFAPMIGHQHDPMKRNVDTSQGYSPYNTRYAMYKNPS